MKALGRWLALVLLAALALQLFFAGRIALMARLDPLSTAFERTEAWRLWRDQGLPRWQQQWRPWAQISPHLQRAVIAAEDDNFVNHVGVDWDAIEKAWERNANAQAQAARQHRRQPERAPRPPAIRGGSTITQQLAKNLLLSGERSYLRKGQEFLLTLSLEAFLSKRRILELYLNHVEWGAGIFGAEAAARHYFGKNAAQLTPTEAARLAVMLPAPKRFEKNPGSAYLAGRTRAVLARMGRSEVP